MAAGIASGMTDIKCESGSIGMVNAQNVKAIDGRFDRIFVMERDIQERLVRLGVDDQKITCLDVADTGTNEDLRDVLTEKLNAIFQS